MNVSKQFIIGNNTFYIDEKYKAVIIDEQDNNSQNCVYITFDDLDYFIQIYSSNKKEG